MGGFDPVSAAIGLFASSVLAQGGRRGGGAVPQLPINPSQVLAQGGLGRPQFVEQPIPQSVTPLTVEQPEASMVQAPNPTPVSAPNYGVPVMQNERTSTLPAGGAPQVRRLRRRFGAGTSF